MIPEEVGAQPYLWMTTTGRRTGKPRTVELWFGLDGRTVYMLAGGGEGANWVRNAQTTSKVRVRLGGRTYRGQARTPDPASEEVAAARQMLAAKYGVWSGGRWARTAFCLAVDLEEPGESS